MSCDSTPQLDCATNVHWQVIVCTCRGCQAVFPSENGLHTGGHNSSNTHYAFLSFYLPWECGSSSAGWSATVRVGGMQGRGLWATGIPWWWERCGYASWGHKHTCTQRCTYGGEWELSDEVGISVRDCAWSICNAVGQLLLTEVNFYKTLKCVYMHVHWPHISKREGMYRIPVHGSGVSAAASTSSLSATWSTCIQQHSYHSRENSMIQMDVLYMVAQTVCIQ